MMIATRENMNQEGVIMDSSGSKINVQFDLTETQDFVDGLPDLEYAFGNLRFPEEAKLLLSLLALSCTRLVLEGSGIQAEIALNSLNTFTVTSDTMEIGTRTRVRPDQKISPARALLPDLRTLRNKRKVF
jgi:hypothetical protein